jgi:predicted dehydrogenase
MVLKVGIVDFAGWVYPEVYMKVLKGLKDVKLVSASFMSSDEYMKKVNYGFGRNYYVKEFGVKAYVDIDEMIRKEGLDAVCMFGEYSKKADYIEIAAKNGVDIFTSKPPATTMNQMKRIVEAGQKNGVSITIPEHARFNNMFREVYDKVRGGEIGKLLSARVVHQHGHPLWIASKPDHWYIKEKNGGPEISLCWYTAGLLEWFMDSEAVRVFAEYDNFATEGSPFMDNGKALVRFKNGSFGSMDIYWSVEWPFPRNMVELMGKIGTIILCENEFNWTEYTVYKKSSIITFRSKPDDSIKVEMKSWVKSCIEKTEPELSAEEAMKVLELCIAWKKSAETNHQVCLPLKEV